MFCKSFREDKDIVQVIDCELVEKRSDCIVNDRLEGSRYVSQPKGYNIILEVPVVYPERYLLLVSFFNTDIGVRSREIETYEDTRACQLVSKLQDKRQGVVVLYYLII